MNGLKNFRSAILQLRYSIHFKAPLNNTFSYFASPTFYLPTMPAGLWNDKWP